MPGGIEPFCLKMGNHRIRWQLGSQGKGQESLDVNAGLKKDNGTYSNLRERQFVNNLLFFTLFRVINKIIMILVKQKTKELKHK